MTTPRRTAFDVGRMMTPDLAVAHSDALVRATGLKVRDVLEVADGHRGARGLRRLETALDLVDGGAQSPKQTWLPSDIVRRVRNALGIRASSLR
ncbi:hypothetical protein [Mycobacterium sp. 050134]|uniref:hypothetical protein n=1 Tax=Mycobacterium sp. 050134 TaxID=3096111 RepID=UPI002ED83163